MSRRNGRGSKESGRWLYPSTRWAILLRDDLACVYCGVTVQEVIDNDDGNFITVDHVVPRKPLKGGRKGDNSPSNLVACCYNCNTWKGRRTVAAFARDLGLSPNALSKRIRARTSRNVEEFRLAAKMLLGTSGIPGFGHVAQLVYDHDWIVKRQWTEGDIDGMYWAHLKAQADLFCPECSAPVDRHGHYDWPEAAEPPRWTGTDDDIPF